MTNPKRRRVKPGDVFAIPLPDGNVAFGKRFKDAGIGIYREIGNSMQDTPQNEEYQFIVGVYDYVLKSGKWPFIEYRSFDNEEEAWPPPSCIIDALNGDFSIYYKGEIRDASKAECEGLERTAVWDAHHIIDRIIGDDRWHKDPSK